MVEIMDKIERIGQIGLSIGEKQNLIGVNESWYVWDMLVAKYDAIYTINILVNLTKDMDLMLLDKKILKLYVEVAKTMEGLLTEFGVPLPDRYPERVTAIGNVEVITDKYIYLTMFDTVQSIISLAARSFTQSMSPYIRKKFKKILLANVKLFDLIVEYGKMKNYLSMPPIYRQ
ncbi:DUF3231 family protein [Phosphitispora fastidiosa]|uniref:DUF3231 family protein n=1 Tax=Phosphitispora fastidiosa TaxID=2837202 RepID=UPI001E3C012F|nr:DUF3231 family protein [Phosphitispora fastidiosa]MBU7005170.1 hypothetical protein [Phosphitispora fastidiosa]